MGLATRKRPKVWTSTLMEPCDGLESRAWCIPASGPAFPGFSRAWPGLKMGGWMSEWMNVRHQCCINISILSILFNVIITVECEVLSRFIRLSLSGDFYFFFLLPMCAQDQLWTHDVPDRPFPDHIRKHGVDFLSLISWCPTRLNPQSTPLSPLYNLLSLM